MTADRLREAASLMRERAEAADPSPWTQDSQVRGDTVILNRDGQWVTNVTSGRVFAENVVAFDHEEANAEHIASWHPAVALAVADLLDDIATGIHLGIARPTAAVQRALKIADAYLGGEQR